MTRSWRTYCSFSVGKVLLLILCDRNGVITVEMFTELLNKTTETTQGKKVPDIYMNLKDGDLLR